jgi:tRNA(Leu) C34 or U34 (ribose-2'-O)-methylase TrmL
MRGFFGIGAYSPKTSGNLGILWRSAQQFGAAFMFVIAPRCPWDAPSNTTDAHRHIPLYVYPTFEDFARVLPSAARLIAVEQWPTARPLERFIHPEQAIYLLGAEDYGLPDAIRQYCTGGAVAISTERCINVGVAGSIVMYDRAAKAAIKGEA